MRHVLAAAILGITASAAMAQTPPAANPDPSTPAVSTPGANSSGAPAAGANSFTEAQAKSRIEAAGYSQVSALAKDKDGIWRGKASKAGASHEVSLDYQGNVVPK
ncbi:PepSY domain-containing protein [Chelatococcus sp. GCM10030263]|uniref:PepSY domain-containing protein n=1 Tax=Chelatococcus sp. GCM10030263 TaxID=3273387 RepID=UPI003619A8AA